MPAEDTQKANSEAPAARDDGPQSAEDHGAFTKTGTVTDSTPGP